MNAPWRLILLVFAFVLVAIYCIWAVTRPGVEIITVLPWIGVDCYFLAEIVGGWSWPARPA